MNTDPEKILSPEADSTKAQIDQILSRGLPNFTLREMLGFLLSNLGAAERKVFLSNASQDKANGFYPRSLSVGSLPVEVEVPRPRSGDFRPASLPAPYQRGYSDESQALLASVLASSRSLNSAKEALHRMGLSVPDQDLDRVAEAFVEELQLRNSRPLDPDLCVLYIDAKYVEIRESDRLRQAAIYLAVGLLRDGTKRVLSCTTRLGRENLEDWKLVLRNLAERGLRRVLLIVQDDFSGLLPVTSRLFPNADVQLCVVHMQRNAHKHLSKSDSAEFQQRWRNIKASWNSETGALSFDQLCDRFHPSAPKFIDDLRRKKSHYLHFLDYPASIRRSFSTTNAVEAVNGQLEIMRRNSGGYFHSESTLALKLGIAVTSLENSTSWKRPCGHLAACINQLDALFQKRYEQEAD